MRRPLTGCDANNRWTNDQVTSRPRFFDRILYRDFTLSQARDSIWLDEHELQKGKKTSYYTIIQHQLHSGAYEPFVFLDVYFTALSSPNVDICS